ncbi:MAG TPA: molybdopterin-binding protein, partial [bacterium]|nr:molybdopterin-binding protein [bacterium]
MLIEIITIGDELLSGNVLDTNTQFLSDHLFRHGFMVEYHTGLRDDETKMVTAFETASDRADIVLVTGGLGPTADDFTIEMAAKTFGKKLVCDQSVLHYLETWYAGHHIPLQDNTRKQAHVPEGALTFINKEGTAPGVYCHYKKSHFYFMPGVPREMRWLFTTHILPHILSLHPLKQSVATRFFKTFGSPESALDAELNTLFSDRVTLGGVRVGYRVAFPEITLKLTAYGQGELEAQDKLDEASQIIRSKFASVIYSEDEEGTL